MSEFKKRMKDALEAKNIQKEEESEPNNTEMAVLAGFGSLFAFLLAIAIKIFSGSIAFYCCYNWILPEIFNVKTITFAEAYAIGLIISFFRADTYDLKKKDEGSSWSKMLKASSLTIARMGVVILMAYVVSFYI